MATADGVEVFGYFVGFWLFIFSPRFRTAWIDEFRKESALAKVWSLLQAALSVLFGVVLPAVLVGYVVQQFG